MTLLKWSQVQSEGVMHMDSTTLNMDCASYTELATELDAVVAEIPTRIIAEPATERAVARRHARVRITSNGTIAAAAMR